jgi:hypothetical protein
VSWTTCAWLIEPWNEVLGLVGGVPVHEDARLFFTFCSVDWTLARELAADL